jgi:hypothetical protein
MSGGAAPSSIRAVRQRGHPDRGVLLERIMVRAATADTDQQHDHDLLLEY